MKDSFQLKNKIDATLSSLDKIESANPSPHFYTKVLAKINNTKSAAWETWSAFFLRPAIAFATLCFIVTVNIFVVYSKYEESTGTEKKEMIAPNEDNEAVTTLYDLENEKP